MCDIYVTLLCTSNCVSRSLSPAVALLVTLVGIVGSAPVSHNPNIMDTIEQTHSLISKILDDIPTVHTAWIQSQVSIFMFQGCNMTLRGNVPKIPKSSQSIWGFH